MRARAPRAAGPGEIEEVHAISPKTRAPSRGISTADQCTDQGAPRARGGHRADLESRPPAEPTPRARPRVILTLRHCSKPIPRAANEAAGGEEPGARGGGTGGKLGLGRQDAHVHVGRGAIMPSMMARWMNSVMIR